jgi:pimeloyl-ACP methyl ester carboxylesterase
VRLFLIAYIVVILGVWMFQEQLIFPGHSAQGHPDTIVRPTREAELVPLKTAMGDQIYVLFGKANNHDRSIRADAASRPTLIFFYGNGDNLANMSSICLDWRLLGTNVLGVEYPGYGMSSGSPGEEPFYAAADAAYDYLVQRSDIDKTRIIPVGQSLGTGVAVELATRKPVAGLILLSPYTSMKDMAQNMFPWLPTGLILKHHFNNEQKIGSLQIPVLIVHGKHDSLIPPEMSKRLAHAAAKASVTLTLVNTDHNDLFDQEDEINAGIEKLIETAMSR